MGVLSFYNTAQMDVSYVAIFILVEVICFPVPKEKTSGQTQINLRIIFKY